MKWLKENARTVGALVLVGGMYGLSKFPQLAAERQALEYVWLVLGLGSIGFIPSFKNPPKDGE